MKLKTSVLLILSLFLLTSASVKDEELFKNENLLAHCRQDIPLTYKKKDDIKVAQIAETLKDKELVLLHYNKKTGSVTYTRYYLVSQKSDKTVFSYLVPSKEYKNKKKNQIVAVFIKYSAKYDRFYLAECFDKVLSENNDLKTLLKETN